jgi:hypothetical protein
MRSPLIWAWNARPSSSAAASGSVAETTLHPNSIRGCRGPGSADLEHQGVDGEALSSVVHEQLGLIESRFGGQAPVQAAPSRERTSPPVTLQVTVRGPANGVVACRRTSRPSRPTIAMRACCRAESGSRWSHGDDAPSGPRVNVKVRETAQVPKPESVPRSVKAPLVTPSPRSITPSGARRPRGRATPPVTFVTSTDPHRPGALLRIVTRSSLAIRFAVAVRVCPRRRGCTRAGAGEDRRASVLWHELSPAVPGRR